MDGDANGTAGAADVVITTNGLTKAYSGRTVLDAVDLEVRRGAVYGLVGPNGAGKTTLLSILAGLRRPTAGAIDLRVPRARVAVLPDTPQFDRWLTAFEVVDLARSLSAPDLGSDAVDQALEETGLTDAAHRRVGGFSRGMLQRLGMAATIVGRPDMLLLDEPCAALDPLGRREVLDLVKGFAGRATVLFSSHILDDVQEVCDTVGVLKDGHLLFQGTIGALLVGHAAPGFLIRVRDGIGPLTAVLRLQPWVSAVDPAGSDGVRVAATSLDAAQAGLPAVLAQAGVRLVEVEPAEVDLEQVFLELVR